MNTTPNTPAPMDQPTLVLVHGAWHGGWCWQRVLPLLHAQGWAAHAVTPTGVGERAHLLSGHSCGGIVITGVAPALPTIAAMRGRVRSEPGWVVHELATGHDPMVSAPQALASLLVQAARVPTA